MRMSNAIGRVMMSAALAGWGAAALAQTGEDALARDLTAALKPLYQVSSTGGIEIEAWLDNPSLTYVIGQPMRVMVRPSEDAHITVVNVDSNGRGAVLFPNHFQRDTQVRGGTIVMIPHDGASWRLRVTEPAGVDLIKIIASRQPLSLPELNHLVRASEARPVVALGRSADELARDLVAQLKPDAAGTDRQVIGMRNLLLRIVAEKPAAPSAPAPALTVRADRAVYRAGEKVQLSVTAHRDCHVTLVSVGPGRNAVQLFPGPSQPDDPLIRTGQTIAVPQSPLETVARAPAAVEGVLAVCRDAANPGSSPALGTLQALGRALIAGAATKDPARPDISATSYLVVE